MIIRAKTGHILSMKVGRIRTKGKLAHIGKARGWTVSQGLATRVKALMKSDPSAKLFATVACDGKSAYPSEILKHITHATVRVKPSRKAVGFDPMVRPEAFEGL